MPPSDITGTRPTIRSADPDDADGLARVHVRAWEAAYRAIVPGEEFAARSYERRRHQWAELLENGESPGLSTLVAQAGSAIVGFLQIGASRDADLDRETVGEIHAVNVDPEWWGRGVGTALVAEGTRRLRAWGFREAVLWTFAGNERAIRFYEARGWRSDGTESEWLGVPTIRYRTAL